MVVVCDISVVGCVPDVGNISVSFPSIDLNVINFISILPCNYIRILKRSTHFESVIPKVSEAHPNSTSSENPLFILL